MGRFISLDNSSVITASPDALTDKNLYAYCDNNPVMRMDEDGDLWTIIAKAVAKVVIGVASQYVGDVVGNIASGKTGVDILMPTSTPGEYIAAGVTALIPGNGIGGALVRSIVSEKINRVEAVLTEKEISYSESLGNIVSSTMVDTAFSIASGKVDDLIGKLDPPEYSTYARQISQKKPGIRRKQIGFRRKARIFGVRSLQELAGIGFDLGQSHVGGKVDEIGG